MDPQSAKQVREAIMEMRQDKRTFLITTHNLPEAQMLADRIAIIRNGRIIADGTFADLVKTFAGVPLMELRVLTARSNGLAKDLSDMVQIDGSGANWVRYRVPEPAITNPQLINRVIGLGLEVVTLSPVSHH